MGGLKVAFVDVRTSYSTGSGAGYVASAVKHAGYDLSFFNTYWMHESSIVKKIAKSNYDVLMVSSMTMMFPKAARFIRAVKEKKPGIKVLVGGIHAVMLRDKLLEQNPEIDFVCIGEGETMVVEFLKNFGKDSLYNIDNLAYRKDGKIVVNKVAPPEDLDKLPPYFWDFFRKYELVEKNGIMHVKATRGCPYNCTYCCNSAYKNIYGNSYLRFRPIEKVISDMEFLKKKYNPRFFLFDDEMMLFRKDYAIRMFKEIKKRVDVPFGFSARVEYINKEVVEALAAAGCTYLAIGLECGNEEYRKKHLNRFMTNSQIENAFALIKKAGIFVTSYNMMGFPTPNDAELTRDTVELNRKIKPDYTQMTIFFPLPGTQLSDYCIRNNLIDEEKLKAAYDYYEDSVLKGVSLTAERQRIDKMLNPHGVRLRIKRNNATYLDLIMDRAYELNRFGRSALNYAKNRIITKMSS